MLRNSKIVLGVFAIAVFFSSCDALRKLPTADNDDVYLDPKKDRTAFYKADEPKPAETAVTQPVPVVDETAKNNPYYNDKDFSYDDYYDNQYASRLKRFHNPTYGVGYYDSYYTNSYFYNYNPYQYGVSIYNGYSFWGSSYNNYSYVPNYNWNGYYGYGTNYGYNNYCNNGWYGPGAGYYGYGSPYYNNWYNPYSYNNNYYGYNNGWNNPYGYGYGNNNYGYNNSYDYNSYTYNGPRVSHSGGNSKQVINPGMGPMKLMAPGTGGTSTEPKGGVASTDPKRFEVVNTPKQQISSQGNTVNTVPHTIHTNPGTGAVVTPVTQPVKGKTGQDVVTPVGNNNGNTEPTATENPKPKNSFNGGQLTTPSNNNTTPVINEPVKPKKGLFSGGEPVAPTNNNTNNNNESTSTPKPVKKGGFFNSGSGNNSGGNNNSNNNNSGGNNTTKPAYTPSVPSNGGGGRSGGGNSGGVIKPR